MVAFVIGDDVALSSILGFLTNTWRLRVLSKRYPPVSPSSWGLSQTARHLVLSQEIAGSSPVGPTKYDQ